MQRRFTPGKSAIMAIHAEAQHLSMIDLRYIGPRRYADQVTGIAIIRRWRMTNRLLMTTHASANHFIMINRNHRYKRCRRNIVTSVANISGKNMMRGLLVTLGTCTQYFGMIHRRAYRTVPGIAARDRHAVAGTAIIGGSYMPHTLIVIMAIAAISQHVVVVDPNILTPIGGRIGLGWPFMTGLTLTGCRDMSAHLAMASFAGRANL